MADNAPTIIGDSILVSGHLQGDEDLTVQGRIHGTVNLTKTLVVEETGVLKADVQVRNAIISGVVVGNVTASDSVELTDAGRMVGDINAPRVIIVDGARFRGNVDMGDLDAPRASGPMPTRTVSNSGSTAMTRSASAQPAQRSSVPERRSAPPPPTRPKTTSKPKTKPKTGKKGKAPMAGKKKIKKKVVVKKRR